MILIFAEKTSKRLAYILDTVIKGYMRCDYAFTADRKVYLESTEPKIAYASEHPGSGLFIHASGFLYEAGLRSFEPECGTYKGQIALFANAHEKSDLPFDIFAAAFYLLTRYEELLPRDRDRYGRFPAENSLAVKRGFLDTPVVDFYVMFLKERLLQQYPQLLIKKREFRFISTFDVDHAFAYLHKGFFRSISSAAKALLTFKFGGFYRRMRVLMRKQKDPYDTFSWIRNLHDRYGGKPVFFFLLGDYGKFDKNIHYKTPQLHQLIRDLGLWADIGIHPSFHTPENPHKLKQEIKRLDQINNQVTVKSRQHFLRIILPSAYTNLLQTSILEDYTMGYASLNGFRASTCTPYYYYDLNKEERTRLKIIPFCFMDATSIYYNKSSAAEASPQLMSYLQKINEVGGTMVTLFHNDTFMHAAWKECYESLLMAVDKNAQALE